MTSDSNVKQKPYSEINWFQFGSAVEPLLRALIPFAEMDRPGEIDHHSDEELRDALQETVLQRGHGPDHTLLTNQDFRHAAKLLFEWTGAVPESYWSYEIEFK